MQEGLKSRAIQFLPDQLANQIAAGEVIERPASVVKELLENALDAGATRIDIELLSGGMEGIRVTDNGAGIVSTELPLAISRHATSKISVLDDLLSLTSLGFRGEALASICSVSQWEITSRQREQAAAGRISYETGDQVRQDNHPAGTTVAIRKLFYNTPARRKFLKAERTEFRHCDDVIRRMALARFDVGFYVRHNGRQVHRLPVVNDDIGQTRRVAKLCGENFIHNALVIDIPRSDIRLWGWISKPEFSRQQTDLQYFYINGRVVRDRVVNHAIRVAYQDKLPPGRHAAYVLHLEIDPAMVDINVHPAKYEVRFSETRLVHDFITRSLKEALAQSAQLPGTVHAYRKDDSAAQYGAIGEVDIAYQQVDQAAYQQGHTIFLHQRYAIIKDDNLALVIDLPALLAIKNTQKWREAYQQEAMTCKPLLIPETLCLTTAQVRAYEQKQSLLEKLGFDITQSGPTEIMLRHVPTFLQMYDFKSLLLSMLENGSSSELFAWLQSILSAQDIELAKVEIKACLDAYHSNETAYQQCVHTISEQDLLSLMQKNR
jgi:DNA mismatch repair protein MutL